MTRAPAPRETLQELVDRHIGRHSYNSGFPLRTFAVELAEAAYALGQQAIRPESAAYVALLADYERLTASLPELFLKIGRLEEQVRVAGVVADPSQEPG